MKSTFLTLSLAATLAAGAAFAQTTTTETAGSGMASGTYGSDWSTTLGSAMFEEDGTTVRSDLTSEWENLSEEDKEMVRRDCIMHMQQSGGETGSTDTATDSTSDTTTSTGATGSTGTTTDTTASSDTTSDTTGAGSSSMVNVSSEQMDEICDATSDL